MTALDAAAANIAERLKTMAERPQALTVHEVIERYMAVYAGRDTSIVYRLTLWQKIIGDFSLEALNPDVILLARDELIKMPALTYKGLDHEGKQIFKPKPIAKIKAKPTADSEDEDDQSQKVSKPGACGKTKANSTINRFMACLGGVFTWAIENRLSPKGWVHPCRGIRRLPEKDGRVRFLDDDERARLLSECKKSKYPRMHALVLTAMLTGARQGELLGLRWRDVDLEGGVARLAQTKNGDRRTLVLLPQVEAALTPFVSSDRQRYVFGSVQAKYQRPAAIKKAWEKAIERAQINDFRFHDLRHCCASYLAQAGVPLNVIGDVLGHRKMDMTRRYAHLTTQTKAAAMQSALGSIGLDVSPAS